MSCPVRPQGSISCLIKDTEDTAHIKKAVQCTLDIELTYQNC